ncbi:unnamed protein product [Phytophthora fragariaefolia]|uniref:Unnamed protein product n=1 Tax=Phytophthora fragariaefolia TaxID=1490495 RepID=A0A9W6WIU4_9STRA|nr:unnamed protein product [Phytophthora fragariaefolia]
MMNSDWPQQSEAYRCFISIEFALVPYRLRRPTMGPDDFGMFNIDVIFKTVSDSSNELLSGGGDEDANSTTNKVEMDITLW